MNKLKIKIQMLKDIVPESVYLAMVRLEDKEHINSTDFMEDIDIVCDYMLFTASQLV